MRFSLIKILPLIFLQVSCTSAQTSWEFALPRAVKASVVVTDGELMFLSTSGLVLDTEKGTGSLRGVDIPSQQVKWTRFEGDAEIHWMEMANQQLVVHNGDSLFILETASGKTLHKWFLEGKYLTKLAVSGEVLYGVSAWEGAFARNLQTGNIIWMSEAMSDRLAEIAVNEKAVFFIETTGTLVSLDKKTGQMLWNNQEVGDLIITAKLAGNLLLSSDAENRLHAFSPDNGKLIWTSPQKATILGNIHVTEGKVVFAWMGDKNGEMTDDISCLVAVDLATGKPLWTVEFPQLILASATAPGGKVMVGLMNGNISGVQLNTGAKLKDKTLGEEVDVPMFMAGEWLVSQVKGKGLVGVKPEEF